MIRRALLSAVLPLCLLACRPGERARSTSADSAGTVAINASTPAGQVALELWQVRGGVSLAEWKNVHPDEPVFGADTSVLASRFLGPWCAYSAHRTQAGTLSILRAAYFYAPPPPSSLAVPDSGAIDLVRQCVLGLVWVNVELSADSAVANALADSVRAQLRTLYGTEVSGTVRFYGSAYWNRVGRFRKDSLTVVSALREPTLPVRRAGAGPRVVTAFAFLPGAAITVDGALAPGIAWTPVDTFPLDSAARLAGLDTALYAPLERLTSWEPVTAATLAVTSPDTLIQPLAHWLAASAALPPPRRAAALYVADQVLDRSMCRFGLCETGSDSALSRLRALGAQITWAEVGGTMVYHHTWLTQARTLSRDSPLGERIFVAQLNAALDFSGACAAGPEGFRRVIDAGERYLARTGESPIAPEVHFLTAEAYRDIVALAHGALGEQADSSRYRGEAQSAGGKALAHYMAAVRAGPLHPAARAAWSRAWWLRAGLVPRDVRFYCLND